METSSVAVKQTAKELVSTVDTAARELRDLNPEAASDKPSPDRWSIQEVIGHLLDSACNNHQRFVRAQAADPFEFPDYQQEFWAQRQDFNATSWVDLVELWRLYNHHLAHVMTRIPEDRLSTVCQITPYDPVTLGYLVEDYLVHLNHHLAKIRERINL